MALPTQVTELWNVWREAVGTDGQPVLVNLIGPAGEYRDGLKRLFLHQSDRPGSLRVLELGTEAAPEADIHLVLLDSSFGPTTNQLSVLRKINPKGLLLLMLGGDEAGFEARRREVATSVGVRVDHVLSAKTLSTLQPKLAKRLITLFDEQMVALARQFPFIRDEAATQEIFATSQQNAMVGALPVPGADLPLMTGNQLKMVMRIAAIYDQPMNVERLKEVLAVVGGGFAFRSAARQVAKFFPGPGWLVAGAMGYGGTLAMGKGAIEYFKRTSHGVGATAHASRAGHMDGGKRVIDTEATVVEPPTPSGPRNGKAP